jgi:hypothetical protein
MRLALESCAAFGKKALKIRYNPRLILHPGTGC